MLFGPMDPDAETGIIRVDTLIKLRWLAVLGQSIALSLTYFVFEFTLPIGLCFAAVAASIWLNLGLRLRFGHNDRLQERSASFLLAFDVLQLAGLLFLTGGLQNPFSILFLAPVMISAVALPLRRTITLMLLMVACATVLARFHLPLPWTAGEKLYFPTLYVVGVWTAIVLGSAFVVAYAFRVAEEARRLSNALRATELVLAREQHLVQLDGLAAAAAHELGTPLATIALVTRELQKSDQSNQSQEDLRLLGQEVQRCRAILGKLTSIGIDEDKIWTEISVGQLIEEVVAPFRHFGVSIRTDLSGDGDEPMLQRNPGVIYGLGNLVENAVDFAVAEVLVQARWGHGRLEIEIQDDGFGFAPEVLGKVGEPYVTTRRMERRARTDEGGLGLGLFIAKTLLERNGAKLSVGNSVGPETGARVRIIWKRSTHSRSGVTNLANQTD